MEFTMLGALLVLCMMCIFRIVLKKGAEIYEVLIVTNISYFLFSGIYHHTYSDSEYAFSDEVIFAGYMGIIFYVLGVFVGSARHRLKYSFINIQERRSSAFHSFQSYYNSIRPEMITFLYIVSLAIKYFYYIKGGRIIYGASLEENGETISQPITVLFLLWVIINNGLLTYGLINVIFKKPGHKTLCLSIIVTELAFSLISRRDFAINVIIILLVYLTSIKKINIRALAIAASLSLITIKLVLPFIFDFRREFAQQYANTQDIKASIEQAMEQKPFEENQLNYSENLATRGYIISSNFELIESKIKNSLPALNGTVALSSLVFIIPYYLFPEKRNTDPPDQIMLDHFALPQYDHSENIPYAAYADFGYYGPLVYGLLIGLILSALQEFCISNLDRHPFASMSSLTYLLVHGLNFEGLPIIHFILIRDIAIIYMISWLFSHFLTKANGARA